MAAMTTDVWAVEKKSMIDSWTERFKESERVGDEKREAVKVAMEKLMEGKVKETMT